MRRMGLRTAEDIQAEYTAVRAAYLKSLNAESYTVGSGTQRSVTRAKSTELKEQMHQLEREYNRLTNGGIKIFGVTPCV